MEERMKDRIIYARLLGFATNRVLIEDLVCLFVYVGKHVWIRVSLYQSNHLYANSLYTLCVPLIASLGACFGMISIMLRGE